MTKTGWIEGSGLDAPAPDAIRMTATSLVRASISGVSLRLFFAFTPTRPPEERHALSQSHLTSEVLDMRAALCNAVSCCRSLLSTSGRGCVRVRKKMR